MPKCLDSRKGTGARPGAGRRAPGGGGVPPSRLDTVRNFSYTYNPLNGRLLRDKRYSLSGIGEGKAVWILEAVCESTGRKES